jgi:hypothetical protein
MAAAVAHRLVLDVERGSCAMDLVGQAHVPQCRTQRAPRAWDPGRTFGACRYGVSGGHAAAPQAS